MRDAIGTCAYCNRPVQPGEQSEWVAHADCEQREREATETLQAELTQPCIVERAAMYDALADHVVLSREEADQISDALVRTEAWFSRETAIGQHMRDVSAQALAILRRAGSMAPGPKRYVDVGTEDLGEIGGDDQ